MQRPRFLFCRCFFRVRLLVYFIFFSFLFYVSFHKHTRNHFMKSGNEKGIQFFRALVQINLRDVISMVKKKKSAFSIGIVWHEIKKKKSAYIFFVYNRFFLFFFLLHTRSTRWIHICFILVNTVFYKTLDKKKKLYRYLLSILIHLIDTIDLYRSIRDRISILVILSSTS